MNIKSLDLRSRLADDAGENSIMQTITIAVSAILIAAGLITAPGLINNARDNNARGDLSNLAYAQEFQLANGTSYASTLGELTAPSTDENGIKIKFTQSDGVGIGVVGDAAGYTLVAISQSGAAFERTSTGSGTEKLADAGTYDADNAQAAIDALEAGTPDASDLALISALEDVLANA